MPSSFTPPRGFRLRAQDRPRRRSAAILIVFAAIVGLALVPLAQLATVGTRWPGYDRGVTLLPNGWRIAAAGRHVQIGDLPLNMLRSPDGRYIVVTNNGYAKPTLSVFDTALQAIAQRVPVDHAWLGLVWHPDGKRLYSAGANENTIYEFAWSGGRLKPAGKFALAPPQKLAGGALQNAGFIAGLAISRDGRHLYATHVFGEAVSLIDLEQRRVVAKADLPAEPYTCLLSADGKTLFVSVWGGSRVMMFDAATLAPAGEVMVGAHPNALMLSKDGGRLFVACASTNAVWVVDIAAKSAREQVSVSLYPEAPVGTTPNGLALSPDGKTMLVANADNNTVAVVDVQTPGASAVRGWVPAGWYPTSVLFDADGSHFFVLNGKGLVSSSNPRGPQPGGARIDSQYTGSMFQGALSTVGMPDAATLAAMTKRVYELTVYTDQRRLAPPEAPAGSPIPRRVGDASPIKYVFYVIRENRTYDQVLGDLPQGNGDPSLTLFGEDVTPNAHAIAREFVLFDSFYVDAEVSYDGHAFSTGAYATDVIEKLWPTNYGDRGAMYLSEGGYKMRGAYGNLSAPPAGYIWDFAKRAGVTVRSYGEFASWDKKGGTVKATVPGLAGLVHPAYPPWDLSIPDNQRVDVWLKEFRQFEQNGELPRLSIIRLPNDHTYGTSPGAWTPRAMIAENDAALGRLVDAITHSRYWRESAVFVLEDDAQNGPDHVDAHRSVALVLSPFTKRKFVDSTLYTTSAMLRTMELILGLPPMSQYDAAATPMYNAFQATPDLSPFTARAARVPLDERNDWSSPGAAASLQMDFDEADETPEIALNEILWQSVRGAGSVMPPPRRTGFVRPLERDEEQGEGLRLLDSKARGR
jgi:YVTN family beta-propeller protein